MARTTVSLYIDDSNIRLLVMRGREVLNWGELRLEPGLVRGTEIMREVEVADRIRRLLRQCRVRAKRVVVGVSGLFCLSRAAVFPQLPRNLLAEAVEHEAKRLLPTPPEQCYLSWQIVPGHADKTQVFMVAIPRRIADALYRTLRRAGLKPCHLDIKPLALSRVANQENAVILDLQRNELDIVVMSHGIPQPIRTVALPDSALSGTEKLTSIKNDLDRTIKFYNSNNPQKPLDATGPLLVSGQLLNEPALCEELGKVSGMRVLPLQSSACAPAAFNAGLYMVNIGLAMREISAPKESGSAVAGLDCLPVEFTPQPVNVTRVLLVPTAVVVLAVLASLAVLVQNASADLSNVRNHVSAANRLIVLEQTIQKQLSDNITKLEKQVTQADASLKTLTDAFRLLEQERSRTDGDLAVAVGVLPDSIVISAMTYGPQSLTVVGTSPDQDAILSYARALTESARFGPVYVSSVKKPKTASPTLSFTITVYPKGAG